MWAGSYAYANDMASTDPLVYTTDAIEHLYDHVAPVHMANMPINVHCLLTVGNLNYIAVL